MIRTDGDEAFEALSRLIAEARGTLRTGDFGRLPEIAVAKQRLVSRLASAPAGFERDRLSRLKADAEGLGVILQAAARGIASARARIEAVRGAAVRLDIYDARGRALNVAAGSNTVERRA